jgi:hypothetical protein
MAVLNSIPITIALTVFSFCMGWGIGGLCCYHCYLVFSNMTTHEQVSPLLEFGLGLDLRRFGIRSALTASNILTTQGII